MHYANVPGIEKPVSRLVQGCVMLKPADIEKDFKLLDAVYKAGFRTFDSSHIYGGGTCDQVFGKWVAERGVRDDIVMMDKCCHPMEDQNRVTPEHLGEDLVNCMENLGFDHIEIFTFHRDDPDVPVGELVGAMTGHVKAGTIDAWGVSNWEFPRVLAAIEYAKANDLIPPAVVSPHYSLAVSYDEPWPGCLSITGPRHVDARQYYREQGTSLFCWSSLSRGFFSGRYRRDNMVPLGDDQNEFVVRCYAQENNFQRLDRANQLAKEKGVSPSQVAVAWVLCGPLNCFPLVACWRPEEAFDNVKACDLKLTRDQMDWLDLKTECLGV